MVWAAVTVATVSFGLWYGRIIVVVIWLNQCVKLAALLVETGLYQVLSGSRTKHKHLFISEWKDCILQNKQSDVVVALVRKGLVKVLN